MTESFPKAGKKSSRPGTAAKNKSQELGSCYFYRHDMLGGERTRQLADNDYGVRAQKKTKKTGGLRVNPRRTIITGASPKEPTDPKLPY